MKLIGILLELFRQYNPEIMTDEEGRPTHLLILIPLNTQEEAAAEVEWADAG